MNEGKWRDGGEPRLAKATGLFRDDIIGGDIKPVRPLEAEEEELCIVRL